MHPILFHRGRLLLYLGAWLVVAVIVAALVSKSAQLSWPESLILTIPMSLVYAFICLTSFYLCRSFPLRTTPYSKLFLTYAIASVLSSSLWIAAGRGWAFMLREMTDFPALSGPNENVVHIFFLIGILLFLLTVFMHYLMVAVEESRAREQLALEQSVLAREAELRALRAQIHPHFLFNSLNSISALTTADPRAAREMSIRLADFLRKTLRHGAVDRIALGSEISLVEDYLAIEQTRFGSRLAFRKEVSEEVLDALVPPLILQPLIENAIVHGIAPRTEGGTVSLQVKQKDGMIEIRIVNPFDPDYRSSRDGGVGLANVSGRLKALHGSDARLSTEKLEREFVVAIRLPGGTTA